MCVQEVVGVFKIQKNMSHKELLYQRTLAEFLHFVVGAVFVGVRKTVSKCFFSHGVFLDKFKFLVLHLCAVPV